MKIQYASDLHLEYEENRNYLRQHPIQKSGDILILAGDITYLNAETIKAFSFLEGLPDYEGIYLIPGNHEFYLKSMDVSNVLDGYEQQVGESSYYLNNKTIYFSDKVRILFTTLWTQLENEELAESMFSDFDMSHFQGRRFTAKDYNYCHQVCSGFLENELSTPFPGKTVIVSHHSPFPASYLPYPFKMNHEQLLHVDMRYLIEKYPVDHWIYGHVHANFGTRKISNTLFHTNQLGYVYRNHH
ncbi:MAG: metallophosphoesterase, partial [Bacteroidota bacterium]